jgi:HlyD family secretion protein
VVAGQAVVELVDPASLWVNTRFDQVSAGGLAAAQPAQVALRSRRGELLAGHVLRTELRADAVTEELLAKVAFDAMPRPLPPIGERAEVTVRLPALPAGPSLPNAALQRQGQQIGVWPGGGRAPALRAPAAGPQRPRRPGAGARRPARRRQRRAAQRKGR